MKEAGFINKETKYKFQFYPSMVIDLGKKQDSDEDTGQRSKLSNGDQIV